MKMISIRFVRYPMRLTRQCFSERGSSVVGLCIFAPIMAMLLFFVIAAGRAGVTQSRVTTASHVAARAATQHRYEDDAILAAQTTALASLVENNLHCQQGPKVYLHELDLSPAGKVRLEVSCKVSFADLIVPGLPSGITVSAQASAVVDDYRSGIRW